MKFTFLFGLGIGLVLSGCGAGSSEPSSKSSMAASSVSVLASSHSSRNSVSSSVSSSLQFSSSVSFISSSVSSGDSSTQSSLMISSSIASFVSSSNASVEVSLSSSSHSSSSLNSSSSSNSTSQSSNSSASSADSSQVSSASTQILYEPFTVDKTTLFSASYKSISSDPATAFFYIAGGSGITQANGQLTIVGGRISIGNRTPAISTTSSGVVSGEFDLSHPYVIKLKISASSGTGGFQVFIDNNTTSASNSPLGGGSRVLSQAANTLVANEWIEIKPTVGSSNSFIALRTESSASVTIDEMIVEYLSSNTNSSTSSSFRSSSSAQSSSANVTSASVASSVSSSSSSQISTSSSSSSLPTNGNTNISADCIKLATDPTVNWRSTSLQTDQEIVECLSTTLGRAVGYGENARGGFDANGNSHLVIITKNSNLLPEQQVLNAISTEDFNWIVFDKNDYLQGGDLAMYRLACSNAGVLTALDNATTEECLDHNLWCANHGVSSASCAATFFNQRLNDASLVIRNQMIKSNTTIDGRTTQERFLFNGFKIGADDSGTSTYQAQNVIVTNLLFEGAGHVEDHNLDPDMLRSTGASHDIWIHKNTFKNTGDSAFDVKVGAYGITMSFNRLEDVLRASLHGSSDSHTIDTQIRTTMHNNFFITSDAFYSGPHAGNNTARRVPLLRHGSAHMFNNVFYNYRKNFASVRVGGTLFLEKNIFLGSSVIQQEKSSLAASFSEWLTYLTKDDFTGGSFSSVNGLVTYSDDHCRINSSYQGELPSVIGTSARDLKDDYSQASRDSISNLSYPAGQDLVDYTNATAGQDGQLPFNSPLALTPTNVIAQGKSTCL